MAAAHGGGARSAAAAAAKAAAAVDVDVMRDILLSRQDVVQLLLVDWQPTSRSSRSSQIRYYDCFSRINGVPERRYYAKGLLPK